MTKAFDFADLEARLKAKGLTEVETLAKIVAVEVVGWMEDSLMLETNPIYKIGVPVLEALKPTMLASLDKIAS